MSIPDNKNKPLVNVDLNIHDDQYGHCEYKHVNSVLVLHKRNRILEMKQHFGSVKSDLKRVVSLWKNPWVRQSLDFHLSKYFPHHYFLHK